MAWCAGVAARRRGSLQRACVLRCSGPKHLTMTMTRAKLEGLVKDLLERTKQPCVQCLKVRGAEGKGN